MSSSPYQPPSHSTYLDEAQAVRRPGIGRRILVFLGIFLLLALTVAVLINLKIAQFTKMGEMGEAMLPAPPAIATFTAEEIDWSEVIESVGTLEAARGVTLSAELPGRISKINFSGGEKVKAGQVLIEQDLSSEKAQLQAARANADLARINLDRLRELFGKGVVSRAELDRAEAEYRALVAQRQNVATSLDKKNVVAPFDGTLGIRLVDIGQEVSAGTPIVSLQALAPILVNFSLPQVFLPQLQQGLVVSVQSDAHPSEEFNGKIIAVNSLINSRTRNVDVQAELSNDKGKLLPGMFVSGRIETGVEKPAVIIPLTAIKFASYGDSVFVVEDPESTPETVGPDEESKKTEHPVVIQQVVQLGRTKGDFVEVLAGISAGQEVAVSGVFKLQNNQPVTINNDIALPYSLEPKVANK